MENYKISEFIYSISIFKEKMYAGEESTLANITVAFSNGDLYNTHTEYQPLYDII